MKVDDKCAIFNSFRHVEVFKNGHEPDGIEFHVAPDKVDFLLRYDM